MPRLFTLEEIKDKLKVNKDKVGIFKDISKYCEACEANIVSCLWKKPELFFDYAEDKINRDEFLHNQWKVYYEIGKEIVTKEEKPNLDEITVGFYLEKHLKLKEKYEEYGGFNTIDCAKAYVAIENLDGYILELHKWNLIINLLFQGYPVMERLKDFKDMTSEEIYDEYEANLHNIALNVDTEIKSYNLCENIDELLDYCDKGLDKGFPIVPQILNDKIGGLALGSIYLLGGLSGTGKTTLTIEWLLPSMFIHNERMVVLINEEDEKKWQKEMLTWIINNITDFTDEKGNLQVINPKKIQFTKKRFREGGFTEDEWHCLRQAKYYLEMKKNNRNITIIPLHQYSVKTVIKLIKKYATIGVDYFVLDTFKHDYNNMSADPWLAMMTDMIRIYDVVKPINKNVHIWVTFQLSKGKSARERYLCQDNIGMSTNMVDVASTLLLIRRVWEDEKQGGKNELQVFRLEGKTKIPVILDPDKNYVIVFTDKNRRGDTQQYQIVAESNLGLNTYKEIGLCSLAMG